MDMADSEFDPRTLIAETRLAILNNWAQERGIKLQASVAEMIAERSKTNIRDLEGVFNQVVATTQFARRPVTLDLAEENIPGVHRKGFCRLLWMFIKPRLDSGPRRLFQFQGPTINQRLAD